MREVKELGKTLFSVAASHGYVYTSFRRYLERFNGKIANFEGATKGELLQVVTEIVTLGPPPVCIQSSNTPAPLQHSPLSYVNAC